MMHNLDTVQFSFEYSVKISNQQLLYMHFMRLFLYLLSQMLHILLYNQLDTWFKVSNYSTLELYLCDIIDFIEYQSLSS